MKNKKSKFRFFAIFFGVAKKIALVYFWITELY